MALGLGQTLEGIAMFYRPEDGHGLPHNPFNAIITPRPIAWISTRAADGQENLAPYSFFNGAAYVPPQIMYASTTPGADKPDGKDSVSHLRETGVFCVNVVAHAMKDKMNASAGFYDRDVDEFELAGVERAPCERIACSRVADAPASLECEVSQIVALEGSENLLVVGRVVGVHLRDDCVIDGKFDAAAYEPLARMGYRDYTRVTEVFELKRPGE